MIWLEGTAIMKIFFLLQKQHESLCNNGFDFMYEVLARRPTTFVFFIKSIPIFPIEFDEKKKKNLHF